jgi:DNA-binding NarL/FixJ family response regulator
MTRVLIISNVRLYREGLSDNLARSPGLTIVAAVSCHEDAEPCIEALRPDVILLDAAAPEGQAFVARLQHSSSLTKVVLVAFTGSETDLLSWAEVGVSGYAPSEASLDELAHVIECTHRGTLHCTPAVAASLLRHVTALAGLVRQRDVRWEQLTPREREILELMGRGLSNKQIAHRLGIEVPTAKNHVHRIFEKLGIHSRGEAIMLTRRWPASRVSIEH